MYRYILHPTKSLCFCKSKPGRFCARLPPSPLNVIGHTLGRCRAALPQYSSAGKLFSFAASEHNTQAEHGVSGGVNSMKTKVARGHNTLTGIIHILKYCRGQLFPRRPPTESNRLTPDGWWLVAAGSRSRSRSRLNKLSTFFYLFESDGCHSWCFGCPPIAVYFYFY